MTPDISLLIERLGGKEKWMRHTCGLLLGCHGCEKEERVSDKPVLIGTVLSKMQEKFGKPRIIKYEGLMPSEFEQLIDRWANCGLSNSLQDILTEAEWEEVQNFEGGYVEKRLKDPNARQLFDFLSTLFPREKV